MSGDEGDFWKDVAPVMKAESDRKKTRNKDNALRLLDENKINYEMKNCGVHLIVNHNGKTVDYYPTTGKFIFREAKKKGRGIFNLLKELNI